ncbi:MAG: ATP synthase F1 subunit epsilon [Eubacteriales bacterium]|nr:ATP synthase F1 subunit epsilon [Eubacteriales bacterium]
MLSYPLQIVSPDGLLYDGEAVMISVRTIDGDVGIRARHANFVTALGMGVAYIDIDETTRRYASCIGGLLAVIDGKVRLVATTFEWADEIDIERAKAAMETAESVINATSDVKSKAKAQARLRRAQIRISAFEQLKSQQK